MGDWLQKRGFRDQVVLATKGGHRDQVDQSLRVTPEKISKDLADSLLKLRVDYIDLYYLHRDDPSIPVSEIIDYLNDEIASGKIRYFGSSNQSPERLAEANNYAAASGKQGFVANQPLWSLGSRNITPPADPTLLRLDQKTYAYHTKAHIALIPYSSQAGGYFSKFAESGTPTSFTESPLHCPENQAIAGKLKLLSEAIGIEIAHLVVAYLFHRPFPVVPIVGCRIASQMEDSFKSLDIQLSIEVIEELHNLDPW